MTRKKIIILSISVIACLVLVWFLFFRKKEQKIVLETENPQIGYIAQSVTATGKVQPVDTVNVGTQVSGTISAIYVDFNSTVKKGQLLAELDKTLLQATVDQFEASLLQAKSNLVYQTTNFNRQKELFATGSISRADYDLAVNSYTNAKASVSNVDAQLRTAKRNLFFTQIYSPIDGVVLNRSVSIGQTVAASFSTPTLFTIAKDITKMQVEVNVDEADIGNVEKAQRVSFTVDAFLEDVFEGSVKEIRLQPNISSNVVTYTTIVDTKNDDKKLKPGMTASITIYTKEINDALLLTAKALKFTPDTTLARKYTIDYGREIKTVAKSAKAESNAPAEVVSDSRTAYVWVLQGNTLSRKKIRTGLNDNTKVEVLGGLNKNEVVVSGSIVEAEAAQQGAASPFMPQRPNREKKK